ncbi:MAG TPA: 3-methyl-2-oxobutanoate hydroxymethyltransferase [Spirillospora sp.]|nr:3-methyl-2-oxobutanoate hydroxymethyltransferase [Spirillospora sp.]
MRLTIRDIQKMKDNGERIVMLTAYDAVSARVSEAAGVPLLLVGDTLGMVVQGHDTTIPVRLEHIIYHAEIVTRVTQRPFVVGDLPFMTYHISPEQALRNAGRLVQEAGVGAVKLEGGEHMAPTIRRIVQSGIPVMAHIGLTPQSVNEFGGFRVQGKEIKTAQQLLRDAEAVQEAGAFAVVLELVTAPLAQMITEKLDIPTIGIGAGPNCDGQVQVFHDILALFDAFIPRHTRRYANIGDMMRAAIAEYVRDVQSGAFPTEANSFTMNDDVLLALRQTEVNGSGDR